MQTIEVKFKPGQFIRGFYFPYRSEKVKCRACGGRTFLLQPGSMKKIKCSYCCGAGTESQPVEKPVRVSGHVDRIIIAYNQYNNHKPSIKYQLMRRCGSAVGETKIICEEHAAETSGEWRELGRRLGKEWGKKRKEKDREELERLATNGKRASA